jgi:hypothetical protein
MPEYKSLLASRRVYDAGWITPFKRFTLVAMVEYGMTEYVKLHVFDNEEKKDQNMRSSCKKVSEEISIGSE